ncbi:hypothetical protein DL96DRAFT_1716085 [Flagelloscypha sp. PMI_526]|nr:hypothetical protein DL96DRAFT_1716085 [Flagelloscypha sp. PMI_526]
MAADLSMFGTFWVVLVFITSHFAKRKESNQISPPIHEDDMDLESAPLQTRKPTNHNPEQEDLAKEAVDHGSETKDTPSDQHRKSVHYNG